MNEQISPPAKAPAGSSSPTEGKSSSRLLSLDALRGFDMFWIVGGEELIHGIYKAWPNGLFGVLDRQMDHKPWAGVACYDLIFPLFVFIVGVSIVFSLGKSLATHGKGPSLRRVIFRSLALYVWGLLVYGGISGGLDHVRWLGVLQRIALCYLFTSILFCFFRWRGLAASATVLLLSYWALLTFVPIRDFNLEKSHLEALGLTPGSTETRARFEAVTTRVTGRFEDGLNLTQHLDYQYLPGRKWDGAYDPEGLLSTLPAIGTCLLGVLAGLLLQSTGIPAQKKVVFLSIAGIASVLIGFAWGFQFPVIKKLWTSSYVLVAGGYSALLLAVFYQVVEIWRLRAWTTPFVWIGMNPITIYLLFHLLEFDKFAQLVVGGPVKAAFGAAGNLLVSVVVVAMTLSIVKFLYVRKIFIRL